MSYTREVRESLARGIPEKACCARAELIALLRCAGSVGFMGAGRYSVEIDLEGEKLALHAESVALRHFEVRASLITASSARLGGLTKHRLAYEGGDAVELLKAISYLDEGSPFGVRSTPPSDALRRECCRRSYLRGAFIGSGSVSEPAKAYGIEFSLPDGREAERVAAILGRGEMRANIVARKGRAVVYVKDGEMVIKALNMMGAHKAALDITNERILKGFNNSVNRQVNCDAQNVERSLNAAREQAAAIKLIDRQRGLRSLPKSLREMAALRLGDEAATLEELGAMSEPPISKSGANNRMRRLMRLADELR